MEDINNSELELMDYIRRIKSRRENSIIRPLNKKQKEERQKLLRMLSLDFSGCNKTVEVHYVE